jgi:hypothetical protein
MVGKKMPLAVRPCRQPELFLDFRVSTRRYFLVKLADSLFGCSPPSGVAGHVTPAQALSN